MPIMSTGRTFTNNVDARYPQDMRFIAGRLSGGVNLLSLQVMSEVKTVKRNDVQTLTIGASGGTFKLGFDNLYTANIAYNATNAQIQAALELVIGSGNVLVTSTGPFVLTFVNEWGYRDISTISIDYSLATGGTVTVARTTRGSVGPVGGYVAWDGTRTDGGEVAKALLADPIQTTANGYRIEEFGAAGNTGSYRLLYAGEYPAANIVGLNTINAPQLGKFTNGGWDTASPSGVNDVQTMTFGAAATAGALTLLVPKADGTMVSTGPITWDTTDATWLSNINTALDAATGVSGGIVATGATPDTVLIFTFSGTGFAAKQQPQISVLIKPTSVTTVTVARTTLGYNTALITGSVFKIGV